MCFELMQVGPGNRVMSSGKKHLPDQLLTKIYDVIL